MGNAFSGSGFWGRRSTPTTVNTPTAPKRRDRTSPVPRDSVNSKKSSTVVPPIVSSSSPQKSVYTISGALTTLISADTAEGPSTIEPFSEFEPLLGDLVSREECEAVRQVLLEKYAVSQLAPKAKKANLHVPAAWTRYGLIKSGPETPRRETPNPPEKWTGLGYEPDRMPIVPPKTPTRPGTTSSKFSKFSFRGMASRETLPTADSQISLASMVSSSPSTANSSSPSKVSALPNQMVENKKKKRKHESDEPPEVAALMTALKINTDYLDELCEDVTEHLGYKTWIDLLSTYPTDFGKLLDEWDKEEDQIIEQFRIDDEVHLRHVNDWRFPVDADDPTSCEFETIVDRQRRAYAELHFRRLGADYHNMPHGLRVIWVSEFWKRTQEKYIEARDRHESAKMAKEIQTLSTASDLPEKGSDMMSDESQSLGTAMHLSKHVSDMASIESGIIGGKKDAPEEEGDRISIRSNGSDKSDVTVTNFNLQSFLQSIKPASQLEQANIDLPDSPPTPKPVSRQANVGFPDSYVTPRVVSRQASVDFPLTPRVVSCQAVYDFADSLPTPTTPKATPRPSLAATETEAEAKRRRRCTSLAVGQLWSPPADNEPLTHGQSKRLASVAVDMDSDWSKEMIRIEEREQQRQKEEAIRRHRRSHQTLSARNLALRALEGKDSATSYFTEQSPAVKQPVGHPALSGPELALQILESGVDDDTLESSYRALETPTMRQRQPTEYPRHFGPEAALLALESGGGDLDPSYFIRQRRNRRQAIGHPALSEPDSALQALEIGEGDVDPGYFNQQPPTLRQPANPFMKDGDVQPGYRDIRRDAGWNMSANYIQRPVGEAAGGYHIQRMPATRMGNAHPLSGPAQHPRTPLRDRNPYRQMRSAAGGQPQVESNPFHRGFEAPRTPEAGERRQGSGIKQSHRRNRHPTAGLAGYYAAEEDEMM
jgi:hypothetical protein